MGILKSALEKIMYESLSQAITDLDNEDDEFISDIKNLIARRRNVLLIDV